MVQEIDADGTWEKTVKPNGVVIRVLTAPSPAWLAKVVEPVRPKGINPDKLKTVLIAKNIITSKSEVE